MSPSYAVLTTIIVLLILFLYLSWVFVSNEIANKEKKQERIARCQEEYEHRQAHVAALIRGCNELDSGSVLFPFRLLADIEGHPLILVDGTGAEEP